jgi:isopenicillin N synthase-like dioxygenase
MSDTSRRSGDAIPKIDIAALFGGRTAARDAVDREIHDAALAIGFMTVTGLPDRLAVGERARRDLLRFFSLPEAQQRRLWKRNFAPENSSLYRGLFPREASPARNRVGYDIGPDLVRDLPLDGDQDLLYERTPLPREQSLPGWRKTAADYYLAMEEIGGVILASLSRGLGIDARYFHDAFEGGISTLRLLHYPKRAATEPKPVDETYYTTYRQRAYEQVARPHVDSGLLTILAQCGVAGLQAQDASGGWLDVPPDAQGFAINFGGLLARWTGGGIKATRHRVLGLGEERFSIPFFFEPRADAVIAPLPIDGIEPFAPFQFGDHLWATTTKFPENFGLGYLRPPRAAYSDPTID